MQNNNFYSMMGLIDEDNLEEIYQQGEWHQFNSLDDVLNMMQKNETGDEDKHSIPDVFGRAIQYKIAFESGQRKSIIGRNYFCSKEILEWRGVITAIALKGFLKLEMKISILKYMKEEQGFDKALKHPPKAEVFLREENWENGMFHILELKGDRETDYTDIAMFSKMTAFYPVADLRRKMPKVRKISWFDYKKRKFLNPADVLTDTEKMIVYYWLGQFRDILKAEGSGADSLLYHLEAYIRELAEAVNAQNFQTKKCFALTTIDESYASKKNGTEIDKIMNRTVKLQMNVGDKCIIEYKDLFADQIYYTKGISSPFTECEFANNHKIQNTGRVNEAETYYAFMPLGKKAVEGCNRTLIDMLVKNMEMTADYYTNGNLKCIKVNLYLTKVSNTEIDIERKYYFNNNTEVIEEEKTDFPVVAIWPPCNIPECKKYYVYLAGGKNGRIEAAFENEIMGSNPYVKAVDVFPKAISLCRIFGKTSYDIGVILPKYNSVQQVDGTAVSAVVGIDFGTSGTTVYAKIDGKDDPMQIKIWEDHSTLFTEAEEGDLAILSRGFILSNKGETVKGKLQSVYRRTSDRPLREVNPILDGIIYQADEKEMIEASAQYMPDIKWDNPMNGSYYEAFIEELCIHIWMKLRTYFVTSIEWRYAFPGSLDKSGLYQSIWNKKIKSFLEQNICVYKHSLGNIIYTESEAASLYFQNSEQMQMVNIDKGYIIVDIGGGSTDIAVWQRQGENRDATMIAQTSVPVAGRMLFTRWIALNMKDIKNHIFPNTEEWDKLLEFREDNKIVNAILERIIHTRNEELMRAYLQESEWSKRLREQLEFGIALLFFALGSFVGHLQEINALKLQDKEGDFSIALGGNGSKILEWVDGENNYSKFLTVFREGIKSRKAGSEFCDLQVIKSKKPKEEVALGLLQTKGDDGRNKKADIIEEITNEQARNWNKMFLDIYNKVFAKKQKLNENDIHALMAGINRKTDVCNFFMNDMYAGYYKGRIS